MSLEICHCKATNPNEEHGGILKQCFFCGYHSCDKHTSRFRDRPFPLYACNVCHRNMKNCAACAAPFIIGNDKLQQCKKCNRFYCAMCLYVINHSAECPDCGAQWILDI